MPILPSISLVRSLAAGLCLLTFAVAGRAELKQNIEYGRVGDERLLLDAYVPAGDGPYPVAILVHGGGWSGGDKSGSNRPGDGADISPWFEALNAAHYTWFSINYRMAPKHRWPACLEDVNTAIRWVKAHAAEYKGDPQRIALFGHSAGGHLVMYAATETDPATRVQAVVGFAPVTNLESDSERRGGLSPSLQNLFGRPKEITPETREILRDASPLQHVHAGMPPILIVHGDADKTVPIEQSVEFMAKLKSAGVPRELIVRQGLPHSLVGGEKIDAEKGPHLRVGGKAIEESYRPVMLQWLQHALIQRPKEAAPAAHP